MNESEKYNRIDRVHLENIASANYYKPVTERNNVFCRLKRNTAVLSRLHNEEENENNQQPIHHQNLNHLSESKHSNKQHRYTEHRKSSLNSIHSSGRISLEKQVNSSQQLPKIRSSQEINLSFDDSRNSSKNEIEGTRIGVLSTKQILKKYEIKKLQQQFQKKQFLVDHIKNLKLDDYAEDDIQECSDSIVGSSIHQQLGQKISKTARVQSPSKKSMNLSQSQQKILNLLQNRLTDRDYIDYNVKLFQKRDINKRKFFQRYHNILKKQRNEISQR